MDRDEILGLTVSNLKSKLTELGLSTSGRKVVLQDRLIEHYGIELSDDEDEDEVFQNASSVHSVAVGVRETTRTPFTLRDIEDSLSCFSGSGQASIEKWLEIFEENAAAVQWNELQKFIYAKQLLKGGAKMFVQCQKGIKDWDSLKKS